MTEPYGTILSPNYPQPYLPSSESCWMITVEKEQVRLKSISSWVPDLGSILGMSSANGTPSLIVLAHTQNGPCIPCRPEVLFIMLWTKLKAWFILSLYHQAWWHHQMETFSAYWPVGWEIHRSPVNSSHEGQWRGALVFSLICAWTNSWVSNRRATDLRRHRAHYDVTIMNGHCCIPKLVLFVLYIILQQK